jgi:hypothetical protein
MNDGAVAVRTSWIGIQLHNAMIEPDVTLPENWRGVVLFGQTISDTPHGSFSEYAGGNHQ